MPDEVYTWAYGLLKIGDRIWNPLLYYTEDHGVEGVWIFDMPAGRELFRLGGKQADLWREWLSKGGDPISTPET